MDGVLLVGSRYACQNTGDPSSQKILCKIDSGIIKKKMAASSCFGSYSFVELKTMFKNDNFICIRYFDSFFDGILSISDCGSDLQLSTKGARGR